MDADWDEISRVGFPLPGSRDYPRPANTIAFDTQQELLWAGGAQGRLMSFYGTELQRYTGWRIQAIEEGPVRQFLFNEKGLIILGTRSIHMYIRRGMRLWDIRHENMKDLHCMSFTSRGKSSSEILVAGCQDTMFVIDVNKGEIVREIPTDHHYTIMKRSRYVCAATKSACVNILDPHTFKVLRSWQAHSSYINDMDAQADCVVTCGGSLKQQAAQPFMLDPYVNVFDLKNMASMKPVPFPPLAAYVRMHPRMLTTGLVTSQQGQMHVMDIMNPNSSNVRYANVLSYVNVVAISSSGEALAMVDNECNIHLWGSLSKIRFNEISVPTEMPAEEQPAPMMDWSHDTPLSTIGMPYYREQLFSAWPADMISDVGAPPVQLEPSFLAGLKPTEWGHYGRNTRGLLRNQVEDTRALAKPSKDVHAPKFLSERARESARSESSGLDPPAEIHPDLQRLTLAAGAAGGNVHSVIGESQAELQSLKPEAPAMYQEPEIKYSKFGVDDFDFGYFNKTRYAGLENQIANKYANSLLQLMHYTPLVRNLALQHAASACLSDPCLLCELGYVFDMLQKAEGSSCQASNLLKALANIPQAANLGLLEEEIRGNSMTSIVERLARFLFDRIDQEFKTTPPASTTLEQALFGLTHPPSAEDLVSRMLTTSAIETIRCMNCRNESTRLGRTHVVDLIYPSPAPPPPPARSGPGTGRATRITFSQVLKAGVERETTSKGWCSRCTRYQNLQMRKTIHSVPAVLALNTAIQGPEHRRFWATPGWVPEEIGIIVDQGQFFCFEGEDLKLHLQRGIHDIAVYSLVGMVISVECGGTPLKSHLVSMVNVAHSEETAPNESRWHLFNDFSVCPVSKSEAMTFNMGWKMPSVLTFQLKAANNKANPEWKTNLDTSVLFADSLSVAKTYQPLNPETEYPGPDMIVGLDTEFVSLKQPEIQMNADGQREMIRPMSHALARVSVVRGQGTMEGEAFLDDYISIKEPVVDYLTQYSGISPGDLDARTSRHNLVPLKTAYKKLWVLLNLGCKFLGHGLKQDFRVINIQIPRAQIIDTIERFYLKSRLRKLSLAFLAWYLLREDIQLDTHDSIEDARTALKLYRKYEEFTDAGVLEQMLLNIYSAGRDCNWKPPRKEGDAEQLQRMGTPPVNAVVAGTGSSGSAGGAVSGRSGSGRSGAVLGGTASPAGSGVRPMTPARRGGPGAFLAFPGTSAFTPGKASPLRDM